MCCFSGPVESVSKTHIFARDAGGNRQFLVYSMDYAAESDLAIVLPLPVRAGGTIEFLDLSGYPEFFEHVDNGFPKDKSIGRSVVDRAEADGIEVVQVGSFDASFVPTAADFARLDPRFRLAPEVLAKLTGQVGFGFAVFKLREGGGTVHPMALSFPRKDEDVLFFPTVHVHDGEVHEWAEFDHSLFCQSPTPPQWEESVEPAGEFVDTDLTLGIVDKDAPVYKLTLKGPHKNEDLVV